MDTRKIADNYKMSNWARAMQERVANGESIKAFCRSKGVSKNTYYYWQRKLREAVCQELMPAAAEMKQEVAAVPNGWAVCEVTKDKCSVSEPIKSSILIEIGKSRVTATADSDKELLANVCRMLVELC